MGTHPIFESDFDCLTVMSDQSTDSENDENLEVMNQWLDFFADAGIPPSDAAQYAINFSEQRIPMDKSIIIELGHSELKELGVDLLGDRLAILKCAKNDKPKKPRAKRRPEKIKKIVKEKEIDEKVVDGDDEIARVLSTVKSKTKFVDVAPPPVKNERLKSDNPFIKSKQLEIIEAEDDVIKTPVQFSVNLSGLVPSKRRSQPDVQEIDSADPEQQVVRPFSSGPIWDPKKKKIQEDVISSSTTNFAITLGTGKKVKRDTGPVVKCSFSSIDKSKPDLSVKNRLGTAKVSKERSVASIKHRLGKPSVKSRLGL